MQCDRLRGVPVVLVPQRRAHLPQQQRSHDGPKQGEPRHGGNGQERRRSLPVFCQTREDVRPGLCPSHTGRSELTVVLLENSSNHTLLDMHYAFVLVYAYVHPNGVSVCPCSNPDRQHVVPSGAVHFSFIRFSERGLHTVTQAGLLQCLPPLTTPM